MSTHNGSVISNFNNTPVLLAPQYADAVCSLTLAGPRNAEREKATGVAHVEMCAAHIGAFATPGHGKPFLFSAGIAVIPVYGVLLHRDSWCDEYATGYDYIRSRFMAALEDDDVQGIVFDIHSPGGMVAGCFELCDAIYAARGRKPMLAVVDGMACSAAYAIASSVGSINATPSSRVGSVGVLTMHMSFAGLLANMGIKATFIYAGAHKVDGNPYEDLPEATRARYQEGIDKLYNQFVSLVARNRDMEADKVRGTEALVYDADDALEVGFIDAIQLPYEAVAAFRQGLNGSINANAGDTDMTDTKTPAPAASQQPATEQPNAAADERARIKAITTHAEAEGRSDLAAHLAYDTDMSVDAAVAMLAKAPKAAAAAAATPFQTAMDTTKNPNVGADAGGADAGDANNGGGGDRVSRILSSYQAAGGAVRKQS